MVRGSDMRRGRKEPESSTCFANSSARIDLQDERERTTAEASKAYSGGIETGSCVVARDESGGSLLTGQVVSGLEVA